MGVTQEEESSQNKISLLFRESFCSDVMVAIMLSSLSGLLFTKKINNKKETLLVRVLAFYLILRHLSFIKVYRFYSISN